MSTEARSNFKDSGILSRTRYSHDLGTTSHQHLLSSISKEELRRDSLKSNGSVTDFKALLSPPNKGSKPNGERFEFMQTENVHNLFKENAFLKYKKSTPDLEHKRNLTEPDDEKQKPTFTSFNLEKEKLKQQLYGNERISLPRAHHKTRSFAISTNDSDQEPQYKNFVHEILAGRAPERSFKKTESELLDAKTMKISNENVRSNKLLGDKEKKVEAPRDEIFQLNGKLKPSEKLEVENFCLKRENKILKQDYDKSSNLAASKIREVETWKNKYAKRELEHNKASEPKRGSESGQTEVFSETEEVSDRDSLLTHLHEKKIEGLNEFDNKNGIFQREIERLESELKEQTIKFIKEQALREDLEEKLKPLVKQNKIMEEHIEELRAFESQNKELLVQISDLSQQVAQLNSEKSKTDSVVVYLEERYKGLQVKLKKFEENNASLQILKEQIQTDKKLKASLANQLKSLENDVELWKSKAYTLENQVAEKAVLEEEMKIAIADNENLAEIIEEQRSENISLKEQIQKHEKYVIIQEFQKTQIATLTDEKKRLETVIENLMEQVVTEQKKVLQLKNVDTDLQRTQADKKRLESALVTHGQGITELKAALQEANTEIDKFKDLDHSLLLLTKQNEKLNIMLGEKIKEIEEHKDTIRGFEKGAEKFVEARFILDLKQREIETLKSALELKSKESEELKFQHAQSEKDHISIEAKLSALISDNEQLRKLLEQRLQEIERSNILIKDLGVKLLTAADSERKLEILAAENQRLTSLLNEMIKDVDNWRNKCKELEKSELIIVDFQSRLQAYETENQRLNNMLKDRAGDMGALQEKIRMLEAELMRASDLQNKLNSLSVENEHLQKLLSEKMKDIWSLKASHTELELVKGELGKSESTTESLRLEIQSLEQMIQQKNKQIEEIRTKAMEYETLKYENEDNKNRCLRLSEHNQHLNRLLSEKSQEITELRYKFENEERKSADAGSLNGLVNKYKHENELARKELESVKMKLCEAESRLTIFQVENERLRRQNDQAEQAMKRSSVATPNKEILQDLEIKLKLMATENQRLTQLHDGTIIEKDAWKRKYYELVNTKEAQQNFVFNRS